MSYISRQRRNSWASRSTRGRKFEQGKPSFVDPEPIPDVVRWQVNDKPSYDDREHLERLQTSWLAQWPPEQQREIFFRQVLPVIAFRLDPDHAQGVVSWPLLEIPDMTAEIGSWFTEFENPNLDLNKVLGGYKSAPLGRLQLLAHFCAIRRADMMYHKLWRLCAEFYLLSLAYNEPIITTLGEREIYLFSKTAWCRRRALQAIDSENMQTCKRMVESHVSQEKFSEYDKFLKACKGKMAEEEKYKCIKPQQLSIH
jgi:hypothetical protein